MPSRGPCGLCAWTTFERAPCRAGSVGWGRVRSRNGAVVGTMSEDHSIIRDATHTAVPSCLRTGLGGSSSPGIVPAEPGETFGLSSGQLPCSSL